jgi:hypothetical protein
LPRSRPNLLIQSNSNDLKINDRKSKRLPRHRLPHLLDAQELE